MASDNDNFSISGPIHLTYIDWNSPRHRRSVAASLVQGAYVLERDQQLNLHGAEARAPPWWEFFHFDLIRQLVDDADLSIFGAIYKLKPSASGHSSSLHDAPKFVIAFRGTITKKDSVSRDLMLDLQLLQNSLHQSTRFRIALQAVRNIVSTVGSSNVWLAGHSLGSALATLVGKNMAIVGIFLESFLFNPPFFSAPIERIKHHNIKKGIRIASSLLTAGLTVALKSRLDGPTREGHFATLSSWMPRLFVNPIDDICSEYIGYFEHRNHMEAIGAGNIEKLATKNSVGHIFLKAFGKESDPIHLLPSANLTINLSPTPTFKIAHGIHQWWKPDLSLQSKLYLYG